MGAAFPRAMVMWDNAMSPNVPSDRFMASQGSARRGALAIPESIAVGRFARSQRNLDNNLGAGSGLSWPELEGAFHLSNQSVHDRQSETSRLPPIKAWWQPLAIVADLHPKPPIEPAGHDAYLAGLMRKTVLDSVLTELADDHGQAGCDVCGQQTEAAVADRRHAAPRRGHVADHPKQLVGDPVEFNDFVERLRQGFVHDRYRGHPRHRVRQRNLRFCGLDTSRLHPKQRRDRLQIVLDPMVDLANRGVLGDQLTFLATQVTHVPAE